MRFGLRIAEASGVRFSGRRPRREGAARPAQFVFADKTGGNPPSQSNFRRRAWNPIVEATGLELEDGVRVTPHSARHHAPANCRSWASTKRTEQPCSGTPPVV